MPEQHFGGDPAQGLGLSISSNELYGEIWAEDPSALKVELRRSLAPRATTMLYDEFARSASVLTTSSSTPGGATRFMRSRSCDGSTAAQSPSTLSRYTSIARVNVLPLPGSRTGSTSSRRQPSRFRLRTRRSISCGAETS